MILLVDLAFIYDQRVYTVKVSWQLLLGLLKEYQSSPLIAQAQEDEKITAFDMGI